MSVPPQAIAALIWAIAGPPLLIYAATRVRSGKPRLHAQLMIAWIVVELAVFLSFSLLDDPNPRRPELRSQFVFPIHVALAAAAAAGAGWQILSRLVRSWRRLHRRTGPFVVGVWCAALLTGIYNYVYLYVVD